MITIHMPEPGGTLASWIRRDGDAVCAGDLLAIVECPDGRYQWVEAPCDGTLEGRLAQGGARLEQGAPLGALAAQRLAYALSA
jgi:pyruvate/2-oxoglutarate dehydrogenase complex dihydrolipoamide acyltransferase (E2) component